MNIFSDSAPPGEFGQLVEGKEVDFGDLDIASGLSPFQLAKEQHFVNMMRIAGMVGMPVCISDSDQLSGPGTVAGLFHNLSFDSAGRWLTHIGPATGQGPAVIGSFLDQQDFPILEDACP